MKKRNYSRSYMTISKAAIRHYYKNQDENVILDWDKISSVISSADVKKYDVVGPTHEQIRLLLNIAEIKYRAVILLLASTGMRREALCEMKLENMTYVKDYKLYKFRVYPLTSHEYVTYCTPEAAEAIDIYLKKERPKKYFLTGHKGKSQSPQGLSVILRNLMLRAKIGIKQDKISFHDKIPSVHGFKQFCITQMKKAKVDTESRKIMTDHEIGVSGGYMHDMDDDLLQEYIKAIPHLTINPDSVKTVILSADDKDKEIATMKSQMSEVMKELKLLREAQKEMAEMTRDGSEESNKLLEYTRKQVQESH
jgi:integrase